ncbi:DMT family transporter [Tropicibacter naphthalenivorans]|uniref:Putative DMT superfamily transporter inner membrane protein n=1 Tax=Tropicibacter naphthalenivorans TaxID=441103 RepID=A0A0P1G3A6_9RHOB|nr:DMT family transporter [Tropicibacter naphthalenivorans]CUH76174.1 putative DMT superfamily transporter inner membrane protein [Tropicibacter naphthalenivorans]SMC39525.1 EamA-like transporter family protein [Tropicibacter naphthalenivorans]
MKTALPFAALVIIGAAWGGTQPLGKIAVSEGYRHFGLIFWQTALMGVLLVTVTWLRGRRLAWDRRALILYGFIAVVGTVLPGIASYNAIAHLPSGVMSILISSVPLFALPIALALGNDRFHWTRALGLGIGLTGVTLLVLPQASLPQGISALWVPVALVSSLCYALEGNLVAKYGTLGLDAFQVLAGASILGALITAPLALTTGQFIAPHWPLGAPDLALLASVVLHAFAYSGYVWLVGQAGSVFAAQVSYLVTLFGVIWAITFLGEGYSGWIWGALALMLAGIALVQPRPKALVPGGALGQDASG